MIIWFLGALALAADDGAPASGPHLRDDWVTSFDRALVEPLLVPVTEVIRACLAGDALDALPAELQVRFKTRADGSIGFLGVDGAPSDRFRRCVIERTGTWRAPGRGTITARWDP